MRKLTKKARIAQTFPVSFYIKEHLPAVADAFFCHKDLRVLN